MLKHNERRINELQRTTEQMKEEKQANERLKRGTKYGRNNAMSSTICLAYTAYLEDEDANEEATGWCFLTSFSGSIKNKEVAAYIREYVIADGGCVSSQGPRLSKEEEDEIVYRTRNFFNGEKVKQQEGCLSEDERKKKNMMRKKMNTRRDRKLRWRKAAFKACKEQFDNGSFGTTEELLEFREMTSSWRSEKLNRFYRQLDDIHDSELRKHSNERLHCERKTTTTWKISDLEVAALPHWCVEGREGYDDM
ncbi:hypothetical protein HMPREF1544_00652 [Mucor circinelloides 1006PhL]|uniref:Uncharacterized protein n=1 Tax=Mucor circinelloides f. circinelloides (strain 1006PhL) TaxID=1220926 RepID=S2KIU4_MUCC1|nr:hypothetical protein HMPREF1544_00652 [Mucor circinelloides 1006PhL]